MAKYAIHPGYVTSKTDGQEHYISAGQLTHLYGLKSQQCIIIRPDDRPHMFADWDSYIHLYPRYDGDYHNYGEDEWQQGHRRRLAQNALQRMATGTLRQKTDGDSTTT